MPFVKRNHHIPYWLIPLAKQMSHIKVEGLSKRFGQTQALEDVSFEIT